MPWFRVDDSFYDHPKVYNASDGALALWLRAGTWSARNLTDGYIPADMAKRFGTPRAAQELVTRGLWTRVKGGGYRFHDWKKYQPTRAKVNADREAAKRRMRLLRQSKNQQVSPENVRPNFARSSRPPTRPITTDEASTTARPQPRLPNHNFDEFKINGVVATRQPPPFAEAVQHALNPERKT